MYNKNKIPLLKSQKPPDWEKIHATYTTDTRLIFLLYEVMWKFVNKDIDISQYLQIEFINFLNAFKVGGHIIHNTFIWGKRGINTRRRA